MQWTVLTLVGLLFMGISGLAEGTVVASTITSEKELQSAVLQLDAPASEMPALRRLIKVAGFTLYEGSMFYYSGDEAADQLRREATRAVRAHRNVESVRRALDVDDRAIRNWGVMNFEIDCEKRESWKGLLPRLEAIASNDADAGIRREAILRLRFFEEGKAFLKALQEVSKEADPSVLMALLEFDSQAPAARWKWYARAKQFLLDNDETIRSRWLSDIYFSAWNPSTAPMWRVEADPGLIETLCQVERTGSQTEQELASRTLQALGKGLGSTARERIAEQVKKMHQELTEPSPTRQGIGGVITHEYALAQSIIAFERIVNYYHETQKTWTNDPVALAELKVTMVKETDPTAKDIMKVALAMVGEKEYETDLIRMLRRDDQPTIRQYTIGALGDSKAMAALPDLLTFLKDPYEIPAAGCVRIDSAKTVFPIRDAAAFSLRQLGVKVKEVRNGQYEVDQQSLDEALGKTRKHPTDKGASQAPAATHSDDR